MAVGSTPRDSGNIPLGCVLVPGDTTPQALQGGKEFTDANSNVSSPARMEITPNSKATYSYAISATAPYATPTDWIVIRGSATKLVKILRFEFSGVATAATTIVFTLRVHTTANTAGTSTNPAPIQHDSTDAAPTALVLLYTVAPTISGSPGPLLTTVRYMLTVLPAASAVQPDRFAIEFGAGPYEPVVLRGVAQEIAINFAGAAIPSGGVYDARFVWTEE
jgi:hypothetical protein